ncbi:MAG: hypothetical protein JWP01_4073 [Myxococcales bacterium]|nr:hypothetical protein [Myxococcales bacterium]
MSSAQLAQVLAQPGSIEARHVLARAWEAAGDPRGTLLRALLDLEALERDNYNSKQTRAARVAVRPLLEQHRKALVGDVAGLVADYELVRGLVGKVTISVDQFLSAAPALFAAAPVQHLVLTAPATQWASVVGSPYLERLVSVQATGLGLGDGGASALAASPHAARLRWIDLADNGIGRPGVERLAAAPQLASVAYLGLRGNPADPTPKIIDLDGIRHVERPPVAVELERTYGPRPWLSGPADPDQPWPPRPDDLARTA